MNYKKNYNCIIEKAKLKNRQKLNKTDIEYIYYERHHIIPRCLNGGNEKENLVLLTAKEHFIAHKLLTYIYPYNRKIVVAFYMMVNACKKRYNISARDYAYSRKLFISIPISEETREKISKANKGKKVSEETRKKLREVQLGEKSSMFGKEVSRETKEKMSNSSIGKKKSEKAKKNMSLNHYDCNGENNGMFGRSHKEEAKRKISNSVKNRKKIICKYCNKELNPLNYTKWHGENCKYKND